MPVQNNFQQQAVAANMGSADKIAENLREEILHDVRTEKTTPAESITKQALDGTGKKVSVQILAGLAAKLGADALTAKISNKFGKQQESDFLTENKEENFSDKVDLNFALGQNVKSAKGKQGREGGGDGEGGRGDDRGRSPEVKDYVKSYSSFLINGGGDLKKEIDKKEKQLLQEGKLSTSELASLRVSTAKEIRQEIVKQLETAYNDSLFADGTMEELVTKQGVNQLTEWAFMNEKLGGKEFGGDFDHLKGANDEALAKAKDKINDTLQDELTKALAKKMLSEGKEADKAEKEIGQLLKLAAKCGFDVQNFAAQMPEQIIHLGLNPSLSLSLALNLSNQSASDQGRRDAYQYSADEEKDLMMEELRTLYMRRAVYGDWRTNLETSVRMIRSKNGLIKLGLRSEDITKLEKEGRQLAKAKLRQMLTEAFEERSSFAKLSGPAYSMIEKKIKTILKNLDKLGVELDDSDLEEMRNAANEKMFPELQHELTLIDNALQARDTDYLQSKRKTVLQIMDRLAQESNIAWQSDNINNIAVAT
jgi:hypothetical protein